MNSNQIIIIMGCIIISLLFVLIFVKSKRNQFIKLNSLLINRDYKGFELAINSFKTKILFNKGELTTFLINKALMTENEKEMNTLIEDAIKMRLSNNKLIYLLMSTYNYYISKRNEKRSTHLLELIKEHGNAQIIEEAEIIYSVYILKNDQYLDLLLERLETRDEVYRGVDEFLISMIYENKKETALAKKYRELSKEHMELLDKSLMNKQK